MKLFKCFISTLPKNHTKLIFAKGKLDAVRTITKLYSKWVTITVIEVKEGKEPKK